MAIRLAESSAACAGLGFVLAGLAQLLSVFLAGAHGWVTPFFVSIVLWLLLPVTLSVGWPIGRHRQFVLLGVAVIALGADALLISRTVDEGNAVLSYVKVNGVAGLLIIGLWPALWLFWQVMLIYTLIAGQQRSGDANA